MYIYVIEYAELIFKHKNAIQAILSNTIRKIGGFVYKNAVIFTISHPSKILPKLMKINKI